MGKPSGGDPIVQEQTRKEVFDLDCVTSVFEIQVVSSPSMAGYNGFDHATPEEAQVVNSRREV